MHYTDYLIHVIHLPDVYHKIMLNAFPHLYSIFNVGIFRLAGNYSGFFCPAFLP